MYKNLEKVKTRLFGFFLMELFGIFLGFIMPFIAETTPTLDLIIKIYDLLCSIVFISAITPLCNLLTDLTNKK